MNTLEFKTFTENQFMDTTEPFRYAYEFRDNSFALEKILSNLAKQAKPFGMTNIKNLYKAYEQGQKKSNKIHIGNTTDFTGQTDELATGEWKADDAGISTFNAQGIEEFACVHPITIKERLTNIDTGIEKLKLSFSRARKWRDIIVPKNTIASSNKIIELADQGVAVTSENSRLLVRFLHDLEHENYQDIEEKKCCSRLGWIGEENSFAPYCEELTFDGDPNLSMAFKSVKPNGDYAKWKTEILKVCDYNFINKIVIGASFAAPLIKILGINNFWMHLWADTETAKTVSMMCGASIWGNPKVGKYIQTFNSTNVGKERFAELANNIPVFFDELQIITDKKIFDHEIYSLCEGAGKLRGNKYGGTDRTSTWQTCFISTGEKPIMSESSAGGAVNRVIEVQCSEKLIPNGQATCEIINENYGEAGRRFIKYLSSEAIKTSYLEYYKAFEGSLKTEKQTSIGAVIVTAFNYASQLLFDSKMSLTVDEVSQFLNNKATVSPHMRSYNYLIEFISRNINKFNGKRDDEIFGKTEGGIFYIIKSVFDKICDEGNFNATAFLSWGRANDKIVFSKDRNTVKYRISGVSIWCVGIRIEDTNDIPF